MWQNLKGAWLCVYARACMHECVCVCKKETSGKGEGRGVGVGVGREENACIICMCAYKGGRETGRGEKDREREAKKKEREWERERERERERETQTDRQTDRQSVLNPQQTRRQTHVNPQTHPSSLHTHTLLTQSSPTADGAGCGRRRARACPRRPWCQTRSGTATGGRSGPWCRSRSTCGPRAWPPQGQWETWINLTCWTTLVKKAGRACNPHHRVFFLGTAELQAFVIWKCYTAVH